MKRTFFSLSFLLFIGFSVFAQKTPAPPVKKDQTQNITIRKKGGDQEKTTIVIDGDRITVNGKPLEDYKGSIQITETDGNDFDVLPPAAPISPLFPNGGAKSYTSNFSFHQNSAFLGVYTEADSDGAKINSVTKNSPADKAGLKENDVITKVNSDKVEDANDLMDAVGKYKPQDKVTITYLRNKTEMTANITLEKNKQTNFAFDFGNKDFANRFKALPFDWDNKPHLGMHVQDVEAGTGIRITDIDDEDSPAAKAGLKEDDTITKMNGKTVASVKDAKDVLAEIKRGDDVTITYQRNGNAQTATVHIPKPLQSSDL